MCKSKCLDYSGKDDMHVAVAISFSATISSMLAGNFRGYKFSRKSSFLSRRDFRGFNLFAFSELLTTPLYRRRANRGREMTHGKG